MSELIERIERTPEQLAAIEARKEFLKAERDREEIERQRSVRRRKVDTMATARLLLKRKLVTQHWIDRKSPAELKAYVKTACIAYQVDAISVAGTIIPVINLMQRIRSTG